MKKKKKKMRRTIKEENVQDDDDDGCHLECYRRRMSTCIVACMDMHWGKLKLPELHLSSLP